MALLASNAVTAAVRQALTHGLASIASQAKTIRDGAGVPADALQAAFDGRIDIPQVNHRWVALPRLAQEESIHAD